MCLYYYSTFSKLYRLVRKLYGCGLSSRVEIRPYPAGPFERPHNRSPSSTINKLTTPATTYTQNITRAPIDEAAAYWFTYYYYCRVCILL